MIKIIHKQGKEIVDVYVGLGYFQKVKGPYCDGAKGLWSGKSYHVARYWKDVTCKKCLNKRKNENNNRNLTKQKAGNRTK